MKRRTILYLVVGVVLVAAVAGFILLWPDQGQEAEQETRSATIERGTLLVSV